VLAAAIQVGYGVYIVVVAGIIMLTVFIKVGAMQALRLGSLVRG
jgi:hypothetical protein